MANSMKILQLVEKFISIQVGSRMIHFGKENCHIIDNCVLLEDIIISNVMIEDVENSLIVKEPVTK